MIHSELRNTHTHTQILPFEQPLVDGGQCEHFEQQPDGQWEEDQREALDEQVEANVKQRTGQLLQKEEVRVSSLALICNPAIAIDL